ncbi:hypothetical protein RvY_12285 [Ramazzottius varieornatus]|uniref:PX domain-containing protein n=1 Tax=Ramazzottius varieornatus TaxID=947166 RepID=A0A1D1VIZ1_RAMVA|nr:hypothetical protein RvY_12285 [Ramazzottius varieornatus]
MNRKAWSKMHFSIADTEELLDAFGSTYISYRLCCNGTYHGSARYREFFDLHETLRKDYHTLPCFPPKKLFNLTAVELSGRRTALEKYMQNLGQSSELLNTAALQDFLQRIQLRSCDKLQPGTHNVFLLNGNCIEVKVDPKIPASELLEMVCHEIKLPSELTHYFALFLAKEENKRYTLFKRFFSFELPFVVCSLNSNGSSSLRIILRKGYWDSSFDAQMLESRVGTNLLFVETVDAINRGWILPSPEQKSHLENLQSKGSRKELVQVAQTVRGYGTLHFATCTIDYPSSSTTTKPYITAKDLICPLKSEGSQKQEAVFRVVRMRCWRLCVSETYKTARPPEALNQPRQSIMFEYLLGRDKLQWVTIHSEEAIWISSCLQSIVEELMLIKKGQKIDGKPFMTDEKKLSRSRSNSSTTSESLQVSVTITRNHINGNSAFEEIRDEDL